MKTGRGRTKILLEDLLEKIEVLKIYLIHHDREGVRNTADEIKDLALRGILTGDFQGLSARTAARLALSTKEFLEETR